MTILYFLFSFILLVNGLFLMQFIRDIMINWDKLHHESAPYSTVGLSTSIIFFLSALGISDFILSTLYYRKMKLVSDKLLPGTLNTQCVIPVAVMAVLFISVIEVDTLTLFVCIFAQMLGAYLGPRLVNQLSPSLIRGCIGSGLLLAAIFILAAKCNYIPEGGTADALSGYKLIIAALCLTGYGILNTVGIGSYAPTMMTMYALGMNPAIAFPIMMSASALSVPIASIQFIKLGQYSRKITLIAALLGTLGAVIGVSVVHELDISKLQWIVAGVLLYSGTVLLFNEIKTRWNHIIPVKI